MSKLSSAALATTVALTFAGSAQAVSVIQFAQTSNSNTITGTASGGSSTTIAGTDVQVGITQDLGGYVGIAYLDLLATSIDAALAIGTGVLQHYSGSFSVTSLPTGGVNILSGSFTDSALGVGPALSLVIGSPPDTLSLSSDLITASNLTAPLGLSFSLTNVSPSVHIDGTTLASFNATTAGNVSANTVTNTTEPASLAVLGMGLVGLGLCRYRRNSAAAAA